MTTDTAVAEIVKGLRKPAPFREVLGVSTPDLVAIEKERSIAAIALEEEHAARMEAETHADALDAKLTALTPHGTCACSYDRPDDLCLHHSPKLEAASVDNAQLREGLADVRKAILTAPPEVLTDTLWVSDIETAVDRIDALLKGPTP